MKNFLPLINVLNFFKKHERKKHEVDILNKYLLKKELNQKEILEQKGYLNFIKYKFFNKKFYIFKNLVDKDFYKDVIEFNGFSYLKDSFIKNVLLKDVLYVENDYKKNLSLIYLDDKSDYAFKNNIIEMCKETNKLFIEFDLDNINSLDEIDNFDIDEAIYQQKFIYISFSTLKNTKTTINNYIEKINQNIEKSIHTFIKKNYPNEVSKCFSLFIISEKSVISEELIFLATNIFDNMGILITNERTNDENDIKINLNLQKKSYSFKSFDNYFIEIKNKNIEKEYNKNKIILTKNKELRDLIIKGITQEELNNNYDYSQITNMSYMFAFCKDLKEIPLLDTSNVTNMYAMFHYCENLKTIPLLDTSNVTDMKCIFMNCNNLEKIPLLDTKNVDNMSFMFKNCISLKEIPLLNTSNVIDMESMFDNCILLEKIPLLNIIRVKSMLNMFYGCENLVEKIEFNMNKVIENKDMYYGCTIIEKKELEIENKRIQEKELKDENDLVMELNKITIELPNLHF